MSGSRFKCERKSREMHLFLSLSFFLFSVPKNATEVTDVLGQLLPGDGLYWSSSINYLYRRYEREARRDRRATCRLEECETGGLIDRVSGRFFQPGIAIPTCESISRWDTIEKRVVYFDSLQSRRDFRVAARHKFVTLSICPIKICRDVKSFLRREHIR